MLHVRQSFFVFLIPILVCSLVTRWWCMRRAPSRWSMCWTGRHPLLDATHLLCSIPQLLSCGGVIIWNHSECWGQQVFKFVWHYFSCTLRQGYMLYALHNSHPTNKSGISFGNGTWTLLQNITQGKSGVVPTKHAFIEFVFFWLFDRLHAWLVSLITIFGFCNCYFTKLDSWKFKNYNPNSLILHLLIQEQSAWKFTSAQCQGSLVNSSPEYLTSINVQPKATYEHSNPKGNWIGLKVCNQQLHTCNWKWLKKQKNLQ